MATKCLKCHSENPDTLKFCGECGAQLPSRRDVSSEVTETIRAPLKELSRGTLFAGRFEVIEELGSGGMGKVYRVFDKKIEEEVALKLIKPEIAADAETLKRFSNELRLARKIAHRNVGKMYELMEEEGAHFITMEYVPGENLKSMIRMSGQLGVGTAVSVAKQVCEGLSEAHRLGIVHRDLKPSNIMIDKDGNARIMDFGIARSLKRKGMTGAGVIIGTPEYMSPEQVEGKEVDARSDIYSFGVVLYEALTGRVPYEGETPQAVAVKQMSQSPQDPRDANPQISGPLARLILRCLERDDTKRYQSARELLDDLERIGEADLWGEKTMLPKPGKSIAVLPFLDLSLDKDQEYFCDGLAEELINSLTQIRDLKVASRTSAFSLKDKNLDIRDVGAKLQVDAVLEGSVRKAGNRLRITAQLINIADGYHLWSERYDRELNDVFAIQEEIALAIVDKLKPRLLSEEKASLSKRSTENVEAYQDYLRGRFFWNKRTADAVQRSLENYQRAITRDPDFALAYSGLADAYVSLGYRYFVSREEAFAKAGAAARKAIELDETISEAFVALANVRGWIEWDLDSAEKEYKHAIELNPANGEAHHQYAHLLSLLGRFVESIAVMRRALELEPLSVNINSCFGQNLYLARRYDEAVDQLQRTIQMDPHYFDPYDWLGLSYIKKGLYDKAVNAFRKGLIQGEIHPRTEAALGHALAAAGQEEEARAILARLSRSSEGQSCDPYFVAWIQAGLGEKGETIAWLDKAYEVRSFWVPYAGIDPLFDFLQSEPEFKQYLEKTRLAVRWLD